MIALVQQKKNVQLTLVKQIQNFYLRLFYNGDESYLNANKTDIWNFKANDNMSWYDFCLGSISKDFTKDEQRGISLNVTAKVCVPNKTKDLNVSFFNMIAAINESKIITKHVSCKCECKFRSRKCNLSQKLQNSKTTSMCEKYYIWITATCICKNG